MRTAVCCAALAVVLTPANVGAQSLNLTEGEALARLSAESPRARAARAGVEIARADVLSVGRWPNPRLTYDRESVAGVTENIVMVAQPLPITGRRRFEVEAASAMVGAISSRADEEIRRIRADLRLAFAELVAAQTRERQLTTARDRLGELADVLARREAAGDAAATDRARAQAIVASFFADAPDPARIVAVPRPATTADVPALDALVERAESMRGELLALRQETEAAGLAQRAADRRRIPEPEVVAGTKSSTFAGGDTGSVVTVHASIPLFDRGRPERALAVARAAQADARATAFRLVVRGQIAALRAAVLERRQLTERYRTQAVSSAEQIERIAQVSYDAGERSILELLDAYRTGLSARVRQATLDAAVHQAEIELEFASGWEIR